MKERTQARLTLSNQFGYAAGRALSEIYLGYADALSGDLAGGLARMRQQLAELRATGFEIGASYYLALISVVLGRMPRFDEALRAIDDSFVLIERSGQRHYQAEVNRLKGESLVGRDRANLTEAERFFRASIGIARMQNARSWELRAATSLARLLRDTKRRAEARTILAKTYNWFTEGSDTADLRDAKSMLQRLDD
jgi:predicted ATPase